VNDARLGGPAGSHFASDVDPAGGKLSRTPGSTEVPDSTGVGGAAPRGDQVASSAVLVFTPFRLDPMDARLWRGQHALRLKPKSFAVLHYLAAHAGRLVTKGEFLDAVWGDVHVGDGVLKTAIKDIRRVLADSIEAPRFVATVHRRGYRFIAPVVTADLASDGPVEQSTPAMAGAVHHGAERRQLTVMFCELADSARLPECLDPEDLHEVIRAYRGCATAAVERFDGHMATVMGDSVLAYFGYPQAHEDDAERAVRAGLAVTEAMHRLRPGHEPTLQVRIGIATGLVMVGELTGDGPAQEQTAAGFPHNLAMRLGRAAAPDSVLIAAGTRRLVRDLFAYADVGVQDLEGFDESAQIWRVIGESRAASRFEALRGQRLTPLVGRKHELGLLIDRWETAKGGEGQVVLLAGEPGIGKSRLTQALLERVVDEAHVRLRYCCSPCHTNSTLHPVIEQLERAAGFGVDDDADAKLDKLEALLGQASQSVAAMVPLFATLLSIPSDRRYPSSTLTPQAQKAKTFEALLAQLEGLANTQPVLMVLEDAHWLDPTSTELFGQVIDRLRHLPILLLITFRSEFAPPWAGRPHISSITLHRLGREHGAAMIARLTAGRSLPPEVLDQLLAKTDGVPLFVEELTKTVLESGLLAEVGDHYELSAPLPALAIPTTLHDSLMARLDRLASVKEIAQIGAVIGREFSYQLLSALSPGGEGELQEALSRLVGSQLMFRRGTIPNATYSFKHALVQHVAYESLPKSKRRRLHVEVAKALTDRFPDIATSQPETLAHHLTEGGLAEEAIHYWRRAGQLAAERFANEEACAHFERALTLLPSLPGGVARDQWELDLLTALGSSLISLKGAGALAVARVYGRARELSRLLGKTQHLVPALQGLRLRYQERNELGTARRMAEELLSLAARTREPGDLLEAHRAAGVVSFFSGAFPIAREHLEAGTDLCDTTLHGSHVLRSEHDAGMTCLAYAARTLWMLGYQDQAVDHAEQAIVMAQAASHTPSVLEAMIWRAEVAILRREFRTAQEHAAPALATATEHALPLWTGLAAALLGLARCGREQTVDGIAQIRDGVAKSDKASERLMLLHCRAILAEALNSIGQVEEGLAIVEEVIETARSDGVGCWDSPLRRLMGELLLARDARAAPAVEACFQQAVEIARSQQAKSLELRAGTSLARLWAKQGKQQKAHDLLAPIYRWFTEGFDTADLKDAKALLDELA
jgi:class 3 adenylate cyclase/predicted ATPase